MSCRWRSGRRPGARVLGWALLPLVLPTCYPLAAPPPPFTRTVQLLSAQTRHVIVVSIDGLRPDALHRAPAPTLQRLAAEGAFSLHAETILPSKTLPSHTSMLTGVPPEEHGITWNTDRTARFGTVAVPTAFELARQAGLETAAFLGKRKLRHLLREGSLDWASYPRTQPILTASDVAEEAVEYLAFFRPNLLFVHLPDPDLAGHSFGWMTRAYRLAVRRADRATAHILAAAHRAFGDDFVLIVTSDHGGEGRAHGRDVPADVLIPWVAYGQAVAPGRIPERIRTYDTAATALWLLGVPVPANWSGRPVVTGFSAGAAAGVLAPATFP
jgi:arylsulfatase A-like enzyme